MLARHQGSVTTHGVGLVASIATVILMAGNKVAVDDNCFLLVHLPWTVAQGNSEDLQKEIEALDKCKTAMMGYYRRHCKIPEEQLDQYIKDETWFLGTEFADVFDVEVLPCDKQLNLAAKIDLKKFKTLPKGLTMEKNEELRDEVVITAEVTEDSEKIEEQLKAEVPEEEKEPEAEQKPVEETTVEETVPKAEVDKRVSGMQAKMQLQINDLKAEYEAKIKDFVIQLEAKDKELTEVKDQVISLTDKLQTVDKELQATASALSEKNSALEMLNASVNTPAEELPDFNTGLKACKSPKEVLEFIKSGKYKKN